MICFNQDMSNPGEAVCSQQPHLKNLKYWYTVLFISNTEELNEEWKCVGLCIYIKIRSLLLYLNNKLSCFLWLKLYQSCWNRLVFPSEGLCTCTITRGTDLRIQKEIIYKILQCRVLKVQRLHKKWKCVILRFYVLVTMIN